MIRYTNAFFTLCTQYHVVLMQGLTKKCPATFRSSSDSIGSPFLYLLFCLVQTEVIGGSPPLLGSALWLGGGGGGVCPCTRGFVWGWWWATYCWPAPAHSSPSLSTWEYGEADLRWRWGTLEDEVEPELGVSLFIGGISIHFLCHCIHWKRASPRAVISSPTGPHIGPDISRLHHSTTNLYRYCMAHLLT